MERLSHYELLSKIASGGMAEIWVARDLRGGGSGAAKSSSICVIKKLLSQHAESDEFIRMFLDEGRIGTALDHPNVVRVLEVGSASRTRYIAMEYLYGEDLRTVNRVNRAENKAIPLAQAIHIITRACAGLHHAHEAKGADAAPLEIVHRDVSPHNVFLTFDGGVKVVDFGIAKSLERRWETKHGILKGKVPYMSPEQIKARRLDRRTDIYAMGIMLYELVLGRRPYVLSAGGDFALMMAIARHDIRTPREVQPDIDPALEAIILRAMTYDVRARYATMLELQNALESFAEKRDFVLGSDALAAYLESLFGAKLDAWRVAQQREDLAKHVVRIEEERAQSGTYQEEDQADGSATFVLEERSTLSRTQPPSAVAPQSAASLVVSTSSAVGSVAELFGITVVTLRGRIDEGFEGAALGGSLAGIVLIDLKNVERITSFGVREWLEMTKAIDEEGANVWLARCSEAVVTQMALIRTFPGKAKVLSFHAPFLCDDCGNAFPRVLDCEHDAGWFREGHGPMPRCPRCDGSAKLDDDAALLAFAAPYAGVVVPERIREILETLEQSDGAAVDVVDKTVTGDETRVRVHRDVDRSVRWNRVLEGIEGRLVVDFRGVPRVSAEGAANFARAMKSLGAEVTSAEIHECPVSVLAALGQRGDANERPRVVSVAFAGRCHACAAARTGVVSMRDVVMAAEGSRAPFVPCRRCNAALDVAEAIPMLATAFAPASSPVIQSTRVMVTEPLSSSTNVNVAPGGPRDPRESGAGPSYPSSRLVEPPPSVGSTSVTVLSAVAPRAARAPRRVTWSLVAAGVVGVAVLAGVATARLGGGSPREASPGPASPSASAWLATEDPDSTVQMTPGGLEIAVVIGGEASEGDLSRARAKAVVAIVAQIERRLPSEVREANLSAPLAGGGPSSVEERFTRDVGAFASPDRIAVRADGDAKTPRLAARYHVGLEPFERAVGYYATTKPAFGVAFAPSLPTREDGALVVALLDPPAVADGGGPVKRSGVTRGGVLVLLDDRPVVGVDGLSRTSKPWHNAVFSQGGEGAPRVQVKLR